MPAAKKPRLRVASPDEQPLHKKPTTITAALESGERDLLLMMRAKLAKELDAGVPPAYLAPISRHLREIDRELRELEARKRQEAGEDGDKLEGDAAWDASAI